MDIFLLEDDDAIAMGLTYSLEPEGYQVTRASTVKEAMRLMAERPFSHYISLILHYPMEAVTMSAGKSKKRAIFR